MDKSDLFDLIIDTSIVLLQFQLSFSLFNIYVLSPVATVFAEPSKSYPPASAENEKAAAMWNTPETRSRSIACSYSFLYYVGIQLFSLTKLFSVIDIKGIPCFFFKMHVTYGTEIMTKKHPSSEVAHQEAAHREASKKKKRASSEVAHKDDAGRPYLPSSV